MMRVDGSTPGEFAATVQSCRVRHADFDPCGDSSSEISPQDGGFVSCRNAFGQCYPVAILKTVGKHTHQHVCERLGRMSSDAETKLLINTPVDVREIDIQVVDRRRLCHPGFSIVRRTRQKPTYTESVSAITCPNC